MASIYPEEANVHMLKVNYISRCQDLKTYGMHCFLVKEKQKGRNRMTPRLLGIKRNGLYRLDNDTKEILTHWSYETEFENSLKSKLKSG